MSTIIQSIEKKSYLIKDTGDIEALAKAALLGDQVPGTYLRALIATTQVRLGLDGPRTSAVRGRVAPPEDSEADLEVLKGVHAEFYTAVLAAVTTPDIAATAGLRKAEAARRAKERNRRSNFARSAKSTLAKYVKLGGNIRGLCVTTITKRALRDLTAKAGGAPPLSMETRAKRFATRMVKALEGLHEQDTELAQMALQQALTQLASRSAEWYGAKPTTSIKRAVEHGQLLKTADGLFWPVSQEAASPANEGTFQ